MRIAIRGGLAALTVWGLLASQTIAQTVPEPPSRPPVNPAAPETPAPPVAPVVPPSAAPANPAVPRAGLLTGGLRVPSIDIDRLNNALRLIIDPMFEADASIERVFVEL